MKKAALIVISGILVLSAILFFRTKSDIDEIDFNTQIRPILNDNCLRCHGGVKQQGGLSFLFPEEALDTTSSGKYAIIPGNPEGSELIKRIEHENAELIMPPEGMPLKKEEIKLLKTWIRQGAKWDTHWAYQAPNKITPLSESDDWGNNEIDHLVLSKLQEANLIPTKEASKSILIRRLSLDLTGLPPSTELVDDFIKDETPEAYEKLVDQLLASPHFGERWAALWLDLARYADSRGYQKDRLRKNIWRYRDWVINAFNQDMPFDQFTIEQLAGDLMPNSNESQLLATAFHRNTMTNDEGGTDDEEFRVAAVIDRVNTTMEVWQGMTISCVQCHSHPYDPIRQDEFYKIYAFFNNTADRDSTNDYPRVNIYSPNQIEKRKLIQQELESFGQDTLDEAYQSLMKDFLAIQPGPVPVLNELEKDTSRITHIFERGNWLVHGDEVKPDVPGCLPEMPENYPKNRLGFAQWLVHPNQPLTARVIVNRFWEQLFGNGLVSTLEDFGTQSELPVHPELLDWLAYQFSHDLEWSVKGLLKTIVLSATYRQSSDVSPQLLEKDPYNELLARGPRFRLTAEQIRDQALAISGLLNTDMYGPSVMPHQPEGVWNVIRHTARWETSTNGDQYRRALYTFWRRVSPYPSMLTFDAPSRELCNSRRIRTNTPLQALVTLNDPVFVEAAEALAQRMMEEGGEKVEDQIQYGFKLVLMRTAAPNRIQALMDFYDQALKKYQKEEQNAFGSTPEQSAMVNVANILLNLNEVITKT